MIVHDLHFAWPVILPPEINPPVRVDPDAVLPGPIADAQRARRDAVRELAAVCQRPPLSSAQTLGLEFVGRQQLATDAQADPGEHVADVPVAGTLIERDVAQHHSFESLAILSRAVRDYRPNHFSPATPRYPGLDFGPLGRPTFPPPPGSRPGPHMDQNVLAGYAAVALVLMLDPSGGLFSDAARPLSATRSPPFGANVALENRD